MQTTRVWFLTYNHKPQSQTPTGFPRTPSSFPDWGEPNHTVRV